MGIQSTPNAKATRHARSAVSGLFSRAIHIPPKPQIATEVVNRNQIRYNGLVRSLERTNSPIARELTPVNSPDSAKAFMDTVALVSWQIPRKFQRRSWPEQSILQGAYEAWQEIIERCRAIELRDVQASNVQYRTRNKGEDWFYGFASP